MCTEKPYFYGYWYYSCGDNPLRFRKNLAERIQKLIMTIDDKIRGENSNMLLTEKSQKYQYYHPENLINMNTLQVKKYYHLIKVE